MQKRWLAGLLAVVLLLSLAACDKKEEKDKELTEEEYLPEIEPPLDVAITDCLPAEQVSAIMDVEMTASDPYEDGTWVIYSTKNGTLVSVNMKNASTEAFDSQVAELSGESVPSLGERALWLAASEEIVFYYEGYMISVQVTDATVPSTEGLCNAIAAKLAQNLHAKASEE